MKIHIKSKDINYPVARGVLFEADSSDYFVGRILTLIETLGLPTKQESSIKDLIKQEIYSHYEQGMYLNSKLSGLIREMKWKIDDEDNRRYFAENPLENREKGLHEPHVEKHGEYELIFTENEE